MNITIKELRAAHGMAQARFADRIWVDRHCGIPGMRSGYDGKPE